MPGSEPMEGHAVTGDEIVDNTITAADLDEEVLADCRSAGEVTFLYLNYI